MKRLLPIALLAVLALPAAAGAAGTAEVQKKYAYYVTYTGDDAASALTLGTELNPDGSHTIVIHDDGTEVVAGRGCTAVDAHEVRCVAKEADITARLGAGEDTLAFAPPTARPAGAKGTPLWQEISVAGEGGDDVFDTTGLVKRHQPDEHVDPGFSGDGGDDLLLGGPTAEALSGGRGIDVLHGGGGNDEVEGGGGHDRLYGEDGHDGIVGDAVDQVIEGGSGADSIEVYGRGDVDVVCGTGEDEVYHGWRLEPGVIMDDDCERTLQQHPSPVEITKHSITFFVRCYDGGSDCSGTLELRWRNRLVASQPFSSYRFTRITLPLSAALSRRMRRHTVTLAMNVRGFLYDVNDYSPSRVGNCWWRTRVSPRAG
jgi:hypothetical protein